MVISEGKTRLRKIPVVLEGDGWGKKGGKADRIGESTLCFEAEIRWWCCKQWLWCGDDEEDEPREG